MLIKFFVVMILVWLRRSTQGTAKSRNTEKRFNDAVVRIPWPQNYDGPASNSSYPYGQYSYASGNSSYPVGDGSYDVSTGWNAVASPGDNGGVTSGQIGGASPHYHAMAHGHLYGNLAADFNNLRSSHVGMLNSHNTLRNSYSDTVTAFNNHVGDFQAAVNALNTLRNDHSNLLNAHNGLMFKLNASNLLQ